MTIDDLVRRAADYDKNLARDISDYLRGRQYGLVYEASKPEWVRLWNKPVAVGDFVNVLPPRGTMEDTSSEGDPAEVAWLVAGIDGDVASLVRSRDDEGDTAKVSDLVAIARFDQPIYAGLRETGRVERGGDRPYQVVINGENFHALQALMYCYEGRVDCIYIDPPYNTGAKDWKYNNNYVDDNDVYRHSKWLTFMEDRLRLAKKLLNPKDSVLICTIDDNEYLRLGLLLERIFPNTHIEMITTVTNPSGTSRGESVGDFSTVNEYIFFVRIGKAKVIPWTNSMLPIIDENGKVKAGPRTVGGLKWESFLRSGKGNNRQSRPNLFYPVYIDPHTYRIVGAGNPCTLPMNRLPRKHGKYAIAWPIKRDGSSAIWHLEKPSLLRNVDKGYAYVSSYDRKRQTYTIQYLTSGVIDSISSGKIRVSKVGDRGQVVADDGAEPTQLPKTVWNMRSHNAGMSGSDLLSQFLPGREFPYPKSLYAVEDALRFFVVNKPDALILDFFSGSGTTAHAVMRLNHQDGGHRRCVCVTNNEVSADEQTALTARNLRQGDPEWEARGICEYVTKPRITAAITGNKPDGDPISGDYKFTDEFPMSDGFEENAVFFDLTYLEPTAVDADLAFDDIAPLLWMRAGSRGSILTHTDGYALGETYAVLFAYDRVRAFVSAVRDHDAIRHVFVVTDIDSQYRSMCKEFRGYDVVRLYQSYLRSFEINTEA